MATRTSTLQPMATSTRAAPAMMAAPKIRTYRDYLTPAFHRRFTHASLVVLILCYVESVFMSQANIFWRIFPVGFTGIRTLLLFLPCLSVFIVRLASLHVGERATTTGFETFYNSLTALGTWATLFWYMFSAAFFGEVYIWSKGPDANLGWVDQGRQYERARLNENPILLRTLLQVLALAQTCVHIYFDMSQVPVKTVKEEEKDEAEEKLPKVYLKLKARFPSMAQWAFKLMTAGMVTITPVYFLLVRRTAWSWAYPIGRLLFSQLPKHGSPAGLIHAPKLVWQAASSSFMLIMLWEFANAVFTIYVSEAPLKREQPLTSEIKDNAGVILVRSQDPNGSLLTGLRAKKETPRAFAFWELCLISTEFDARRKTIFTDGDRPNGNSWAQISAACLGEIEGMLTRIRTYHEPVEGRAKTASEKLDQKHEEHLIGAQQQAPLGLPRIADKGLQDGDVFAQAQSSNFSQNVGKFAKSIGQSPNPGSPLPGRAKKAIEWGADKTLSKEQQAQLSKQGFNKQTSEYMIKVVKSPVGEPFRQTFARTVKVVLFGIPYSKQSTIIHAIRALTALTLASLREDDYGQAAKDVPTIIRTFSIAITGIQSFIAWLQPHWTDVEFNGNRQVSEVDAVLVELKSGLEKLLLAFGEYASSLGMSKKEIREARESLGKGVEMVQTAR